MADSHHLRGENVKTHYITVQRDTQQSTGRAVNASLISVSERGLITTHTRFIQFLHKPDAYNVPTYCQYIVNSTQVHNISYRLH